MRTSVENAARPGMRHPKHSSPDDAIAYFDGSLSFETDANAALESEEPGFVLVDPCEKTSWPQVRVPDGAHLPTSEIALRAGGDRRRRPIVTGWWGPGCDGVAGGALEPQELGFQVVEMVGGFEYWGAGASASTPMRASKPSKSTL